MIWPVVDAFRSALDLVAFYPLDSRMRYMFVYIYRDGVPPPLEGTLSVSSLFFVSVVSLPLCFYSAVEHLICLPFFRPVLSLLLYSPGPWDFKIWLIG